MQASAIAVVEAIERWITLPSLDNRITMDKCARAAWRAKLMHDEQAETLHRDGNRNAAQQVEHRAKECERAALLGYAAEAMAMEEARSKVTANVSQWTAGMPAEWTVGALHFVTLDWPEARPRRGARSWASEFLERAG